jgi:hypothetical protein
MLRQFFSLLFTRGTRDSITDQLDSIRSAARSDAQLAVGNYLDAFEAEAHAILADRQRLLIGVEPEQSQPKKAKARQPKMTR